MFCNDLKLVNSPLLGAF